MTIIDNATSSGPYAADGTNQRFDYTFRIVDADNIDVILIDSNSNEVTVADSDYVVSGVGEDNGYVTFDSPPAAGTLVKICLNPPLNQPVRFGVQGSYNPERLEESLDRLQLQIRSIQGGTNTGNTGNTGGGGTGVTDHGALSGLGGDHHTQYFNQSRGDARYYTKTLIDQALNNKSNIAHNHGITDITGLQSALTGKQATLTSGTTIKTINGDSILGSGNITTNAPFKSLKDFGAVGDGTTSDNAAFTAAEASTSERIYLPEGLYKVDGVTLKKYYWGDGEILIDGKRWGQVYSSIVDVPATDDVSNVNNEYYSVEAGLRIGLNETYFDKRFTPKFQTFVNKGGHSGISAVLTANAPVGATSVTVNAVGSELVVGKEIGFTNAVDAGYQQGYTDTATITGVSGNTITFTPALTEALVASTAKVTVGARTMNPSEHKWIEQRGGGDAYGWVGRIMVWNDSVQPGQEEFIQRATGGIIGGDMYGRNSGVLLTPTEVVCLDTSIDGTFNISTIGDIRNYVRNSDDGTFKCYWLGQWQSSIGTKHCDAISAASGKWKVGWDTVAVDFSGGGHNQSAVNMKSGQRITFDSTSDFTRGPWGNVTGNSYITHSGGKIVVGVSNVPVGQFANTSAIFAPNGTGRLMATTSDVQAVGDFSVRNTINGSRYFRAQSSQVNCTSPLNVNGPINLYGSGITSSVYTSASTIALVFKVNGASYKVNARPV